ncbi:glycosyltransferase family 4 protein [Asticcacaulis sp. AND118]|uniref:glycosyltransferase family 4 protein n=1 Tax=Asticcacaulis sp. AND118 TaxID=2840468 RepID=UPI001CFFF5B7|nr:glycosyltransferase family 4 protein [Asticcacaulis sp. AND118]UDF05038.1 glycosyltransferase family 4 protein [Asticcacaulis sp. AND118]
MRIALCNTLYVTPEAPFMFGGAEVLVRQLAEALVAAGDEVIALRVALDGQARSEIVNGVTVHFLPIDNLFPPFEDKRNALQRLAWHAIDDRWRAPRGLRQILADFRPDVLHSHTLNGLSADVWRVAHGLGIPVVHTLHDYYLSCPRCSRFKDGVACEQTCGSCGLLTTQRRQRAQKLDAVTSVSEKTLDIHRCTGALSAQTPTYVVRNIPNPEVQLAPPLPYEGVLKVGYIGRFAEEKGVQMLIEAIGRLPAEAIELKLAGRVNREEQARLTALAPKARLEFLGFVDPKGFYEGVHMTVAPSLWHEPAGLVVQDSLVAGRPVLCTDRGGMQESIEPGVTGWVVEATAAALAAQLERLIVDPVRIDQAYRVLSGLEASRRRFPDLVREYRDIYVGLSRKAA